MSYYLNDSYDFDYDDEIILSDEALYAFKKFKYYNTTYLNKLYSNMQILYETFVLAFNKKFSKIHNEPEYYELACRLGFGMLMRHCLETISAYLVYENNIDLDEDKTVYDRLMALYNHKTLGYNVNKHKILMKTLDLTNEIAHPHIINDDYYSYEQLREFYNKFFKPLIEEHISSMPLIRYARRDKKMTDKYLFNLKECLDNFDISDKITSTFIKGCLVRHLTECTVNYYSYYNNIVPTDASTQENQISIGSNLTILSKLAKANKNSFRGTITISQDLLTNLFTLKNVSNYFMHESTYKTNIFSFLNRQLAKLYYIVITECSPEIINVDYKIKYPIYKQVIITTLLCGFAGWFGAHHFYSGNIGRGLFFLIFNVCGYAIRHDWFTMPQFPNGMGFIPMVLAFLWFIASISPFFSLNSIREGEFDTSKWGELPQIRLTTTLAVIFMILHIFIRFFLNIF